ncbi:hypothetical protein chiPu_0024555, partial [Chiloscyllium punctatum]|nr:hypothetical protein [Chiloscyllium punctatum]
EEFDVSAEGGRGNRHPAHSLHLTAISRWLANNRRAQNELEGSNGGAEL